MASVHNPRPFPLALSSGRTIGGLEFAEVEDSLVSSELAEGLLLLVETTTISKAKRQDSPIVKE